MAIAVTEETNTSLQKGIFEWWSEESEYIFQRIERWAAFARGYNRLRSQRLFRDHLHEEQESQWSIVSNKVVIDDPSWNFPFHALKRSRRRKCCQEETKINCCGTFNYRSNSNLDSTCLENYRYDHSIYFKTIGEIRSDRKDIQWRDEIEEVAHDDDEQTEWEARSVLQINNSSIDDSDNRNRNNDHYDSSELVKKIDFSNLGATNELGIHEPSVTLQNACRPVIDSNEYNLNVIENESTNLG